MGNEEAVGQAIKKCGVPREELFITTKAYIQQMGYENTKAAFEESLKKMGLEYLDLYLVHMPFGDYYGSFILYICRSEIITAPGGQWKSCIKKEGSARSACATSVRTDCWICAIMWRSHRRSIRSSGTPHYQRKEDLEIMNELGVQPQAWAPFAEGLKGMFDEPVLKEIAEKYGKTPAQIILRWNVQQGVIVIPKTVHKERMRENLNIWDFELDETDMMQIAGLDKDCPSMLDTRKISEVRRVYDYLNNPVLTSL